MHKDEMWQLFYPNGEPIDGAGWESALDNPKGDSEEIVGVAVIFLFRKRDDGKIELLWQRRSDKVDRFPGKYDISAGGHINLGESVVEAAVRELDEEIGAKVVVTDLNYVTMRPFDKHRFAWIFTVDYSERVEDYSFNDGEVSEVRWVLLEKTEEFQKKYAKKPLKKDNLTIECLREWFRIHGYLQAE